MLLLSSVSLIIYLFIHCLCFEVFTLVIVLVHTSVTLDIGATESVSSLNLGKLNLDELDQKIAKVMEETEEIANISSPPPPRNGLFCLLTYTSLFSYLLFQCYIRVACMATMRSPVMYDKNSQNSFKNIHKKA